MTEAAAPDHPRPDRRRDRWLGLDGPWAFSFGEPTFDRTIAVPFAPQAEASGVGDRDLHEVLWYRRRFVPPPWSAGERVLVHVGAVDHSATMWIDGLEVGAHTGGHVPWTVDVTGALAAGADHHELTIRAVDEYRSDQLRGKQTATFPFMIHYTATSGIWQSGWCEVTGAAWIDEAWVVADADGSLRVSADLCGAVDGASLRATVHGPAGPVELTGAPVGIEGRIDGIRPWSPDDPALYDLDLEILGVDGAVLDRVHGHVGFRTLTIDGDRWLLNGAPLYQRLVLDQGTWPESLLTPPSTQALLDDLAVVRALGANGVRKHQKIEDPRFLWHADRMGVLVWEELPSPFGLAKLTGALGDAAEVEWTAAIRRDRSHPCVVAWVPINESWGVQGVHHRPALQDVVRRFAAVTRRLDPTRPVVDNSGWGHVDTDVVDVHDYDQDPDGLRRRWTGVAERGWVRAPVAIADEAPDFDLRRWLTFAQVDDPAAVDPGELMDMVPNVAVWADGCAPEPGSAGPLLLSEFGGVGYRVGGDPTGDRFDYAAAADAEDLLERMVAQIRAVESVPELRGWCWTQLRDVEQEINGICGADGRPKVDLARLRAAIGQPPV